MNKPQNPYHRFRLRTLTHLSLVTALVWGASARGDAAEPGPVRPNILVILCDDLGYADVGFNGSPDIRTPHLDQLARDGMIFTSAYVVHPFCGPSRMAMMTGRYPHLIGAPFNLPNRADGIKRYNRQGVPVNEPLISSTLQAAGYFTGAIGKWHMGIEPQFHPNNRGFDEFYGFLGGGHHYFPAQFKSAHARQLAKGEANIDEYLLPLEHNGREVDETDYVTDALSREAITFVKTAATKDAPFFLYLAYNAPHSPLQAKEADLALYPEIKDIKRRTYAAMVHAVDRGVGRVVDALKATDALDNTLILFLSDNGGKLELGANNDPLRDGKGSTFEGGYRVPMLLHWPQQVRAGSSVDVVVSALDFYPTLAALAHAALPTGKQLDGKDLSGIWRDGKSARDGEMIYAVRYRLGYTDVGAREGKWKIARVGRHSWQLFDLEADIGEQHDLSHKFPSRLREMVARTEAWSRDHITPLWFNSEEEEVNWVDADMPRYDETFRLQ